MNSTYKKYLVDYEPVIGLEVHTQLLTESKAFSPEPSSFGSAPNSYIDAISLAHPGTLPVMNGKLSSLAVQLGLALNCKIRPVSFLARKHYFYPDLPKGYQISQFEDPICYDGKLKIEIDQNGEDEAYEKTIGITRIHMEEDAGKSIHDLNPNYSMIDLNRCGVALLETVSEPEIGSPLEAVAYLKKLHTIVTYLGICDGNMEEGSFRCDANISVRPRGQKKLGTKAEIKNMNSFKHVEAAIAHEFIRQAELLKEGKTVVQETRLWDPDAQSTQSMRGKEEAHDYRYFPDPDLLRVQIESSEIEAVKQRMPEMPEERISRLVSEFALPKYDAEIIVGSRLLADYFDKTISELGGTDKKKNAKHLSNILMTEVLRVLGEGEYSLSEFPISPTRMAGLVTLREEGKINSTVFVDLFNLMLEDSRDAVLIANEKDLIQVSDSATLEPLIDKILGESHAQVAQYKSGKTGVIGYFIGQVMRQFDGSPDPNVVKKILEERIADL